MVAMIFQGRVVFLGSCVVFAEACFWGKHSDSSIYKLTVIDEQKHKRHTVQYSTIQYKSVALAPN